MPIERRAPALPRAGAGQDAVASLMVPTSTSMASSTKSRPRITPSVVDRGGDVGAVLAHPGERVLEVDVARDRHEPAEPLRRDRFVELLGRQLHDVLHVEVARRVARVVGEHVAGVAVLVDRALDVGRGGRRRQQDHVGQRHLDVGGQLVGELEGAASERPGPGVEGALAARLLHDPGDLLEGEAAGGLVLGLDPEEAQHAVGHRVEHARSPDGRPARRAPAAAPGSGRPGRARRRRGSWAPSRRARRAGRSRAAAPRRTPTR